MFTTVGLPKITWAKPVTMRFRHRKCHTFGSKLPWLQIVSAMVLGRNSRGVGYAGLRTMATSDNGQRTTDNGQRRAVAGGATPRQLVNKTTRLLLRKTTSQQDYETTSGR